MKANKILRLAFSSCLIPIGAVLVVIVGTKPIAQWGPASQLFSGVGLAAIITGIDSLFRQIAILRLESEETGEDIARRVHKLLAQIPIGSNGIRLLAQVRKGFDGYYTWAIKLEPQELFFAGRSVLHRVDDDFRRRSIGPTEEVITRRLKHGATIRILFLDPGSDLIARLAAEEGQDKNRMMFDIGRSLGIVLRLYHLIQQDSNLHHNAQLQVRLYDKVPYFAYHKEDDKVIVGFYFSSALGSSTAAFDVIDPDTQNFFAGHFLSIFDRATPLLEFSRKNAVPAFNTKSFEQACKEITDCIGEDQAHAALEPATPTRVARAQAS